MYGSGGGLFGDLPTAKSEKRRPGGRPGDRDDAKKASSGGGDESSRAATSAAASSSSSVTEKAKKPVGSLVGALGVAGTTMAFVPAALRARKRQVAQGSRPGMHRTSSGGSESSAKKAKVAESLGEAAAAAASASSASVLVVTSAASKAAAPLDVHASATADATSAQRGPPAGGRGDPERSSTAPDADGRPSKDEERQDEADAVEESEALRRLHESVSDPYDPHVPNDYLAYRERKKAEVVREEMERKALEQLELQKKMRERIEEERRKAEASGDVTKIVESRLGPQDGVTAAAEGAGPGMGRGRGKGRGRGRGMANLPAWLVKKQQEEREKAGGVSAPAGSSGGGAEGGQFDDAGQSSSAPPPIFAGQDTSGRLVVLGNMVAPGEVDDDLPDEVREECEGTCGPVRAVKVRDARPPSFPEVRVFVLFERPDHAERAAALFHGRKFGERRIAARLATKVDGA